MSCHPPVGFRPMGAVGAPTTKVPVQGGCPHRTIPWGNLGLWLVMPDSVFWIMPSPVPEVFPKAGPKPSAREEHLSPVTAGSQSPQCAPEPPSKPAAGKWDNPCHPADFSWAGGDIPHSWEHAGVCGITSGVLSALKCFLGHGFLPRDMRSKGSSFGYPKLSMFRRDLKCVSDFQRELISHQLRQGLDKSLKSGGKCHQYWADLVQLQLNWAVCSSWARPGLSGIRSCIAEHLTWFSGA